MAEEEEPRSVRDVSLAIKDFHDRGMESRRDGTTFELKEKIEKMLD